MTSCSVLRSSDRSATICFGRTISPLKCLRRFISVGIEPEYFFLPVEVGRLTDPRLVADLRNRRSLFALRDDEHVLRVRNVGPRSEDLLASIRFRVSSSQ